MFPNSYEMILLATLYPPKQVQCFFVEKGIFVICDSFSVLFPLYDTSSSNQNTKSPLCCAVYLIGLMIRGMLSRATNTSVVESNGHVELRYHQLTHKNSIDNQRLVVRKNYEESPYVGLDR